MDAIRSVIEMGALGIESLAVAVILIATAHGRPDVPELVAGGGDGRALAMEEVSARFPGNHHDGVGSFIAIALAIPYLLIRGSVGHLARWWQSRPQR